MVIGVLLNGAILALAPHRTAELPIRPMTQRKTTEVCGCACATAKPIPHRVSLKLLPRCVPEHVAVSFELRLWNNGILLAVQMHGRGTGKPIPAAWELLDAATHRPQRILQVLLRQGI